MLERKSEVSDTSDREIVVSRVINAPRELVYEAFTKKEHVDHWHGPRGFTIRTHAMDARPGGLWTYVMQHAEYGSFENRIEFLELVPPERLVYLHGSDQENDPNRFHVTVTFVEQGGKTHLTLRSRFNTAAQRDEVVNKFGAIEGGNQTLERLDEYLAKKR
jgi:uncharacterized protein YndB with AHSA1/START domain